MALFKFGQSPLTIETGNCLAQLPNPPTGAPTTSAWEAEFFYPQYELPWSVAGCTNRLPLPFVEGGRPTYTTMLACCRGSYGWQASGACFARLPSPPTGAPTTSAFEAAFFYPVYELPWSVASCSNRLPLPFVTGSRPTYGSKELCCARAYGGQASKACVCSLDDPPSGCPTPKPTTSPTRGPTTASPTQKPTSAPIKVSHSISILDCHTPHLNTFPHAHDFIHLHF